MSLEFKWQKRNPYRRRIFEPIELGDDFNIVFEDTRGRRKTVSNGRIAFEILSHGKKYDQLLLAYELEQRRKQTPKTTVQKQEVVPVVEVVEQIADVVPEVLVQIQTDEEAEQEFLNAVSTDERTLYEPLEDEWFSACVVHRDWKTGKYLLLELSTGDIVYCPWQKVTRSPGNHTVCLALGTECSVRMKLDRGKYWALEMQTEGDEPHGIVRAQISKWHGMAGSAYRECGCSIFVLTTQAMPIQVGDWVEIIHRPSEKRGWIGYIQRKIIDAPNKREGVNHVQT